MNLKEQERKVEEGLEMLIPKQLVGFEYIKMGVSLAMQSTKIELEKKIYPEIAREYGLSEQYVKSSFTSTIEAGLDKNPENFEEFFGTAGCNTPAKFIKAFAKKMNAK